MKEKHIEYREAWSGQQTGSPNAQTPAIADSKLTEGIPISKIG